MTLALDEEYQDSYLTEREVDVVALLAKGLNTKQIAECLNISVKTLWRETANAQFHLKATKYTLVDKARRMGIIR